MKLVTILLLFTLSNRTIAQPKNKIALQRDSIQYYQKELKNLYTKTFDSLRKSEQVISINNNIKRLRGNSNIYFGFSFFADLIHSKFDEFNKSIAQNGFEPMNSNSYRFGFGISKKNNRRISDFYIAAVSTSHISANGNQKIKSSLNSLFQFDFGYDLFKSTFISIYPFAGISLRFSSLEFSKPDQLNSNYTNITNIIANIQSIRAESTRIGYQGGIGIDLVLSNNPKTKNKIILFSKGWTNQPIWKDKFKIYDVTYNPNINLGNWLITLGFKFMSPD